MGKKLKSAKALKVTEEYILEKFIDLMDSDANWNVKVKGLELLGKYLNMFQDQKKVDINVRSLIAGASLEDLQRLTGERDVEIPTNTTGNSRELYLGMHSPDRSGSTMESGDGMPSFGSGEQGSNQGDDDKG